MELSMQELLGSLMDQLGTATSRTIEEDLNVLRKVQGKLVRTSLEQELCLVNVAVGLCLAASRATHDPHLSSSLSRTCLDCCIAALERHPQDAKVRAICQDAIRCIFRLRAGTLTASIPLQFQDSQPIPEFASLDVLEDPQLEFDEEVVVDKMKSRKPKTLGEVHLVAESEYSLLARLFRACTSQIKSAIATLRPSHISSEDVESATWWIGFAHEISGLVGRLTDTERCQLAEVYVVSSALDLVVALCTYSVSMVEVLSSGNPSQREGRPQKKSRSDRSSPQWTADGLRSISGSLKNLMSILVGTIHNLTAQNSTLYWTFRSSVCYNALLCFLPDHTQYEGIVENFNYDSTSTPLRSQLEMSILLGWSLVAYALQSFREYQSLNSDPAWKLAISRKLLGIDDGQRVNAELVAKAFLVFGCVRALCDKESRQVREKASDQNISNTKWQEMAQVLLAHLKFLCAQPELSSCLVDNIHQSHINLLLTIIRLPSSPLKQTFEPDLVEFGQLLFSWAPICATFGVETIRHLTEQDGSLATDLPAPVLSLVAKLLTVGCDGHVEVVGVFLDAFLKGLESSLSSDTIFRNISLSVAVFRAWPADTRFLFLSRLAGALSEQSFDEDQLFNLKYCRNWQALLLLLFYVVHNISSPRSGLSANDFADSSDVNAEFTRILALKPSHCTYVTSLQEKPEIYSSFINLLNSLLQILSSKLCSVDDDETPSNKRHRSSESSGRPKRNLRQPSKSRSGDLVSTKRKRSQETASGERFAALHLFSTLSDLLCVVSSDSKSSDLDLDSLVGLHHVKKILTNFFLQPSETKQAFTDTAHPSTEVSDPSSRQSYSMPDIKCIDDSFSILMQAEAKLGSTNTSHCEFISCAAEAVVTMLSSRFLASGSDIHLKRFFNCLCALLESCQRTYCSSAEELLVGAYLEAFREFLAFPNAIDVISKTMAFSSAQYSILPEGYNTQFPSVFEQPSSFQAPNPDSSFSSFMEALLLHHFAPISTSLTRVHSIQSLITVCLDAMCQLWNLHASLPIHNNTTAVGILSVCQTMESNRFFTFTQTQVTKLVHLAFREISSTLPLQDYIRAHGPDVTREWITTRRIYDMIGCLVQFLSHLLLSSKFLPRFPVRVLTRCLEHMKSLVPNGSLYSVLFMKARETGALLPDLLADFVYSLLRFSNQVQSAGTEFNLPPQCHQFLFALVAFGGEFKYGVVRAFLRLETGDLDSFVSATFFPTYSTVSSLSGLASFQLLQELVRPLSSVHAACEQFNKMLFEKLFAHLASTLTSKISNIKLSTYFTILISLAFAIEEIPNLVLALLPLVPSSSANALCCILNILAEFLEFVSVETPQSKKLCSFLQTGSCTPLQHVFECFTCSTSNCCLVCKNVCHRDHDTVYEGQRQACCDCGTACTARAGQDISSLVKDEVLPDLQQCAVAVLRQLTTSIRSNQDLMYLPQGLTSGLLPNKVLTTGLFTANSNTPSANNFLQSLLSGGQVRRDTSTPKPTVQPHIMAVIAPNMIVIAEGSRLNVFNRLKAIQPQNPKPQGTSKSKPRTDLRLLLEETMPFSVISLKANACNPAQVAVCGRKQCHVVTFGSSGNITQRVVVELSLDVLQQQDDSSSERLTLLKVEWVPISQFLLAVTTNKFVKIYDLAKDAICPEYNCNAPRGGLIKDAAVANRGSLSVFVLTADGRILVDGVTMGSGPHDFTTALSGFRARSKGKSIHYSHTTGCLFVSWIAQACCALRIDAALNCVEVQNVRVPQAGGGFHEMLFDVASWIDVDDPQMQDREFVCSVPTCMDGAVAALVNDKDNLRLAIIYVVGSRVPVCVLAAQSERKTIGLVDSGCITEQSSVCILQDNGSLTHFLLHSSSSFAALPLTKDEGAPFPAFIPSWPLEAPNPWIRDPTIFQRARRAWPNFEGDLDASLLEDAESEASSSGLECVVRARIDMSSHYIVGLRVCIGKRGATSLFLAELGREVGLEPNSWTDIPFSYVESQLLAMHSNQLNIVFSSTSDEVIVNAIQAYVIPKPPLDAMFGPDPRTAAAEALCAAVAPPSPSPDALQKEWTPWAGPKAWATSSLENSEFAKLQFIALCMPTSSAFHYSYPTQFSAIQPGASPTSLQSSPFIPASTLLKSMQEAEPRKAANSETGPSVPLFPPGVFLSRAEFAQWHASHSPPLPLEVPPSLASSASTAPSMASSYSPSSDASPASSCSGSSPSQPPPSSSSSESSGPSFRSRPFCSPKSASFSSLTSPSSSVSTSSSSSVSSPSSSSSSFSGSSQSSPAAPTLDSPLSKSSPAWLEERFLGDATTQDSTYRLASSVFRFIRRVWDRKQDEEFKQLVMNELQPLVVREPFEVTADAAWTSQGLSQDLQTTLELLSKGAFDVRDGWVFQAIQNQLEAPSPSSFWNCIKITRALANSRPKMFEQFVQQQPQFAIDLLSPARAMLLQDGGCIWGDAAFGMISRCLQIIGPQEALVQLATDGLLCLPEEKGSSYLARQVRYSAVTQLALTFFPHSRKRAKASASLSQDVNMARLQAQGKAVRYRCDSCNLFPITGVRWRCLNDTCKEFDLCEDCHSKPPENKQMGSHRRSHSMQSFAVNNGPPSEDDNEKLYDRILVPPGVDSNDNETLMRMAVAMSLSMGPSMESFQRFLPVLLAICSRVVSLVVSLPPQQPLDRLPYLHFLLSCTVHFALDEATLFLIVDLVVKQFLAQKSDLHDRLLSALFLKTLLNVPHNRSVHPHLLQTFTNLQTELWDIVQSTVAHSFPQSPAGSGLLNPRLAGWEQTAGLLFDRKTTVDNLFNDASHRLLTAVLCLLLTLYPLGGEGGPPVDVKTLCLCEIIYGLDSAIGKHAKRLLDSVCGCEAERHKQFDQYLFSKEVTRLLQLPLADSEEPIVRLSYSTSATMQSALTKVVACAKKRPQGWLSFVQSKPQFLQYLLGLCVRLPLSAGFMLPVVLHLLALLHNPEPPTNEATDVLGTLVTSTKSVGMEIFEPTIAKFLTTSQVHTFIQTCLLDSQSLSLRENARSALLFAWTCAASLRPTLLDILAQWLPFICPYGPRARQLTNLFTTLAARGARAQQLSTAARVLLDLMRVHQLVPNGDSPLINALAPDLSPSLSNPASELAEPFYLSSQPCLVCNSGEQEFKSVKLKNLELETKFTFCTKLIRLNSRYWFKSLCIGLSSLDPSKLVRTVEVLFAPEPVSDLSGLPKDQWTLAESVVVEQGVKEIKLQFAVPFSAHNLMIRFANFYQTHDALEVLTCPRCHFPVTNKHGNCPKCRENAYQCRSCRNINFENLDGFLCNECGFSRFASFHYSAVVRPCFLSAPITSESSRQTTVELIGTLSDVLAQRYAQIANYQRDIRNQLTKPEPDSKDSSQSSPAAAARSLYNGKCRRLFEEVSECYQRLLHARLELARYVGKPQLVDVARDSPRRNPCTRCSSQLFFICVATLEELLKINPELFRNLPSISSPPIHASLPFSSNPRKPGMLLPYAADIELLFFMQCAFRERWRPILCALVHNNPVAFEVFCGFLRQRFRSGEDHLHLLVWICKDLTHDWEAKLSLLLNIFFDVLPLQSPGLTLPLLTLLKGLCPPTASQAPPAAVPEPVRTLSRGNISLVRFPTRSPLRNSSSVWASQRSPTRVRSGMASPSPRSSPTPASSTPEAALAPLSLKDEVKQPALNINASVEDLLQHCLTNYEAWRIAASSQFDDWFNLRFCGTFSNGSFIRKSVHKWMKCAFGAIKSSFVPTSTCVCCKSSSGGAPNVLTQLLFVPVLSIRTQSLLVLQRLSRRVGKSHAWDFVALCIWVIVHQGSEWRSSEEGHLWDQFFLFCDYLMREGPIQKYQFVIKGILPVLLERINREIAALYEMENSFSLDVVPLEPRVLSGLITLLLGLMEEPLIRIKFKRDKLPEKALQAFLRLRGLVLQSTKATTECANSLFQVVQVSDTDEDKRGIIEGYLRALENTDLTDKRTQIFILEQICSMIKPVEPPRSCQFVLKKASSQEEFIRGSMKKNPYSLSDFKGDTMQAILNKIVQDLQITLTDPNMFELLVDNRIVNLSLPIVQVYERVWLPSIQPSAPDIAMMVREGEMQFIAEEIVETPMVIIYRLTGLDGEATEDVVETLVDNTQAIDPEQEYALASAMQSGLWALLARISRIKDIGQDLERKGLEMLLKTTTYCCKLKANRSILLQWSPHQNQRRRLGASCVAVFVKLLTLSLKQPSTFGISKALLDIITSLLREAEDQAGSPTSLNTSEEPAIVSLEEETCQLQQLFESLDSFVNAKSEESFAEELVRVLPGLTFGLNPLTSVILEHFLPFLDWGQLDTTEPNSRWGFYLKCFVKFCQSIPSTNVGNAIREYFMSSDITRKLLSHLAQISPGAESKSSQTVTVNSPSLPFILGALTGLVRRHQPSQQLAVELDVIRVLHYLEGIASSNKLGPLAESLLEALSAGNNAVTSVLANLRSATKETKKSIALAKRQKILQQMSFQRSKKDPSMLQATHAIVGMDQLDEQRGLRCLVCQEGYSFKPLEIMGLYVFNKAIPLGTEEDDIGVSTVTHFNVIHYSCHYDAMKADRRLKPPKTEWEGAAIRNSHTLCNNIFPIHGPSLSDQVYEKKIEDYWGTISPHCKLTRFELLVEDLRVLLSKFAYEESFSEYSKGGAKESNIKFILYIIQMGMHLFEKTPPPRYSLPSDVLNDGPSDLPVTTLVETLMLWSYADWEAHKFPLLQHTLLQQIPQDYVLPSEGEEKEGKEEKEHKEGLSEEIPKDMDAMDLIGLCRPVFLMFSLISSMHDVLHTPRGQSESRPLGNSIPEVLAHRKNRIRTFDSMILEDLEQVTLKHYSTVILPCKTIESFLEVTGMESWLSTQGSSGAHLISQLQDRWRRSGESQTS